MDVKPPLTSEQRDMVEANRWLARPVVRRFMGRGIDRDDLLSVAMLAMCRAAQYFQPDRGRFSTFATFVMTRSLKRSTTRDRLIAVNGQAFKGAFKEDAERAQRIGSIDDDRIGGKPKELVDHRSTERASLEDAEDYEDVLGALSDLDARWQIVLTGRAEGRTLRSIGEELGVSKERVRQLQVDAYAHVRRVVRDARIARRPGRTKMVANG